MASTVNLSDREFWTKRNLSFRILILGRANAGKTTILERLTNASESEAEVFRNGRLLENSTVKGQSDRGLHNIYDEIYFPSRPGFTFHDSRGFEAGSHEELDIVRTFVEDSSKATSIWKQLHAIWMCLPLEEARPLFEKEREVFSWSRGTIPLVVIFTKRDGAIVRQAADIANSQPGGTTTRALRREAQRQAVAKVDSDIETCKEELRKLNHDGGPVAFITTSDMTTKTESTVATCASLIDVTEDNLSTPLLKTILSQVWGQNSMRVGYWCFYW